MFAPGTMEEARATARLALPVVLTQLGLQSLSLADSLIVAPLGEVAQGGVGLGNSVFFTISLLALGVIIALDPLVAQSYGAGDRLRCGALLWQGTWLALALAVPLTLLFLDFEWALRLAGQKPETVEAAGSYLRARAWNVPTLLLFAAHRGFLNGIGNTSAVMFAALAANVVNVTAVYALVYGVPGVVPPLGVAGAGYGTAIGGLFLAGTVILVAHGGRYRGYDLRPRRPAGRTIGEIFRFGLPIGGTIVAEVGVFNAAFLVMGWLGKAPLAAHNAAIQLASVTFMVPLGVSVAASVRVGQAIGRGSLDDARRAGAVAYAIGMSFMLASSIVFVAFPEPLARLFTREPKAIALAATLIRIAGLFQLSDGAQAVGAGCLRGAGDSRTAFLVNVAAHWGLGIPLAYALAFGLGLGAPGVWWALTASLTGVAVLLALRFRSGAWRRIGPAAAATGFPGTA